MKGIVFLFALISFSSNAAILADGDLLFDTCNFNAFDIDEVTLDDTNDSWITKEKACHTALTTTSLPTVILDDVRILGSKLSTEDIDFFLDTYNELKDAGFEPTFELIQEYRK